MFQKCRLTASFLQQNFCWKTQKQQKKTTKQGSGEKINPAQRSWKFKIMNCYPNLSTNQHHSTCNNKKKDWNFAAKNTTRKQTMFKKCRLTAIFLQQDFCGKTQKQQKRNNQPRLRERINPAQRSTHQAHPKKMKMWSNKRKVKWRMGREKPDAKIE